MNSLRKNEQKPNNENLIFTKETFGVVLVLFSTLCLVCLITRETIFSSIGQAVNSFLFGCFGFFAYAVIAYLISLGVIMIGGKPSNLTAKRKVLITFGFLSLCIILQIITAPKGQMSFDEYLTFCYNLGEGGIATTCAGGLVTGVLAYGVTSLLTEVGSYVILGILISAIGFMLIKDWLNPSVKKTASSKFRSSFVKEDEDLDIEISGEKDYPVDNVDFAVTTGKQKLFVNNPQDFALKSKREIQKDQANANGIKIDFSQKGLGVVSSINFENKPAKVTDDYKKKLDYIKTPSVIDMNKYSSPTSSLTNVSDYVNPRTERNEKVFSSSDVPMIEHDNRKQVTNYVNDSAEARAERFGQKYFNAVETDISATVNQPIEQAYESKTEIQNEYKEDNQTLNNESSAFNDEIPFIDESVEEKPFDSKDFEPIIKPNKSFVNEVEQEKPNNFTPDLEQNTQPKESNVTSRLRDIFAKDVDKTPPTTTEQTAYTSRVQADNNLSSRRGLMFESEKPKAVEIEKPAKQTPPINRKYYRPPFDLLETYAQPLNAAQENHEERKQIIQRTLEEFHINAIPQGHIQGPSVTRYEIMMPAGISVKKVLGYDDDLKMRLSAKNGVRIEAPIPGKNLVGIEVANNVKVTVGLKEVMEGLSDKKSKPGSLMFALGKDIVGNSISDDLTKGPHYLIAGATGSGKSVCLHVMIVSLLMRYSPEELKLVLVDPKSVEFRKYEHIPHLLVDEIITEPKRALTLLQWAYDETNKRNEMFTACGGHISNIDDYNQYIANDTVPKLPRIVFVIDELADLMEACKKDLEARIRMIAAKSRSAGIHLVLATQRPSVDVITGTIKANLPSRIALKVMNFADSQTILGEAGAEKLLGNGDMLYKNSSMGDYERYQGAYINGREIANIVSYIKEKNKAYFDDEIMEFLDKETRPKQEESSGLSAGGDDGKEYDELFLNALWTAVNSKIISISSLQRRFQIGHSRAGGLIDRMEQKGFITPFDGSKARKVLLTREEYIDKFGPREETY